MLRRAARHSRTNSVSPICLCRPSAFGSAWKRGKVRLDFRLHTASPVKDRPKYASLLATHWLCWSGIPRPPLRVPWTQTCIRTIGLAPTQSNLERSCWITSRRALVGGPARTTPRGCEWVCHSRGGALEGYRYPKHRAANLRFCQNWPWFLQSALTRQPSSSLPLYPGGRIQTLISSANAEILAVRGPAKGIPCRAGFVPSWICALSMGSKART